MPVTGPTPSPPPPDSARAPWRWRWLSGALLAFVVLSGTTAWVLPVFTAQTDEPAHVATAWAWAHGEVPRLTDERPVVGYAPPPGRSGSDPAPGAPAWQETRTYTANHPPLSYVVAGAVLRGAVALDEVPAGLYALRLADVLVGAAVVVATAALARELLPRRPEVAVAAAGLLVGVGGFVRTSAVLYTDALCVLTVTAALAVAVRLLREGPTRRRVALLALLALLAASVRASGVLVAAQVAAAAAVAPLLHPGPLRGRLAVGAASCAAVLSTVAVGIGWFYVLTWRRYGDPTGAAELWRQAGIHDTGSTWVDHATDPHFWLQRARMLWTPDADQASAFSAEVHPFGLLVALGLVVALVVAVVRHRRAAVHGGASPSASSAARAAAPWVLVLGHVVVVGLSFAEFVAQGGYAFSRYLFPALPVLAVVCAVALACLPWRPLRLLPVLVGTALLALATARLVRLGLASAVGQDRGGLVLDLPPDVALRAGLVAALVVAALLHVAALVRATWLAPLPPPPAVDPAPSPVAPDRPAFGRVPREDPADGREGMRPVVPAGGA